MHTYRAFQIDWDKGKALLHLLTALGLNNQPDVVPIYIGDDKTDEDAFQVRIPTHTSSATLLLD